MDRELKNLTLNISQLAALSGVHRQTAAARLQNLPVAGGHESNLKLYRVVDIVSAFLALPPPVHMDTPSPLTLLVTRKTPSKTSHLTIL